MHKYLSHLDIVHQCIFQRNDKNSECNILTQIRFRKIKM